MSSLTLWYNVIVVLKAVAEIAGLALLGQGLLALLAAPIALFQRQQSRSLERRT